MPVSVKAAPEGLGHLTAVQLRAQLTQDGVTFDPKALKAHLQALAVMSKIGFDNEDIDADPDLLAKVIRWCTMSVATLEIELTVEGLKKAASKWLNIENLIRNELKEPSIESSSDGETEDETENETKDETKDEIEEEDLDVESDDGPSKSYISIAVLTPSAAVLNLIITLIWNDAAFYPTQFDTAHPDCPTVASKIMDAFDKIALLKDTKHITKFCKAPKTETERLISWMCATFGTEILEAAEEAGFRVPGFPPSVQQFVLFKPSTTCQEGFAMQFEAAKSTSMLLFHGTSLESVRSLLRHRFTPAGDDRFGRGLFMAEDPHTSYRYAEEGLVSIKEHVVYNIEKPKRWKNTPFPSYGVLLGCEVAGKGRKVPDGHGVHVINKLDSIIIRYIFVIPGTVLREEGGVRPPKRAVVRPVMTAAFKVIREELSEKAQAEASKT